MAVTILFAILALVLFVLLILVLTRSRQDPVLSSWLQANQSQMQVLQQTILENSQFTTTEVGRQLAAQTREMHERLSKAAEVIGELKREAGQFSEISRSMKDLDALLKSPKLRGNMGERVLSDLLKQVFPSHQFFLQHRFSSGAIVDAAIQTDAGLLPIDAKFPLENFQAMLVSEGSGERSQFRKEFQKDVRRHIDAIANKYILPQEGTMDFALLYLPSEAVYYEVAADDVILSYARDRRVYPVSPTTFYAHLQTILLSFEGKKIEQKTQEAFILLRGVERDYNKFAENFETLGRHLTNAMNMFATSKNSLHAMEQGIARIKGQREASEPKHVLPTT